MVRRIAHAVRGLKFGCRFHFVPMFQSHRSRGAWIEISLGEVELYPPPGRIAHAVRGLKFADFIQRVNDFRSHRSRGAWIEI